MLSIPRWLARLVLATVALLASLVVVGVVGEWAVRRRERTRTMVPGTMSQLFYRHTRLLHGMVRDFDYYGWVHIGRQGFRGPREVAVTPPDSVFRVIAVGGSTTFDGHVSGDSSSWPARLEQVLNEGSTPVRFEVLNAGVPGFQVFDDLVRLEWELYRFHPRALILYQGHNDLFNALAGAGRSGQSTFDPRPGEVPTVFPWQRWFERHSLLYNKVRSRLEAVHFGKSGQANRERAGPERFEGALDAGVENFARNVRMFVAVARSLGIDVIIPQAVYAARSPDGVEEIEALWRTGFPFAPREVVWRGYARYDSVARAVASDLGAVYVPASDSSLWQLDGYGDDIVHFGDRGAWRFARLVAPAVHHLLDR